MADSIYPKYIFKIEFILDIINKFEKSEWKNVYVGYQFGGHIFL